MTLTLPPPDIAAEPAPSGDPSTGAASQPGRNTLGFVRPHDGRLIGGVCAAIADRNGWSRTTVRVVTALSILLPGPQVLAYLVAWAVIPADDVPAGDGVMPSVVSSSAAG